MTDNERGRAVPTPPDPETTTPVADENDPAQRRALAQRQAVLDVQRPLGPCRGEHKDTCPGHVTGPALVWLEEHQFARQLADPGWRRLVYRLARQQRQAQR